MKPVSQEISDAPLMLCMRTDSCTLKANFICNIEFKSNDSESPLTYICWINCLIIEMCTVITALALTHRQLHASAAADSA